MCTLELGSQFHVAGRALAWSLSETAAEASEETTVLAANGQTRFPVRLRLSFIEN